MRKDHPASFSPLLRQLWFNGFLAGLAVVLIGLLAWFVLRGTSPPPTAGERDLTQAPEQEAAAPVLLGRAPMPPAYSPPRAAPDLKAQLQQVLATIKEANQKKDLTQLLGAYTPSFVGLAQKARQISKSWQVYDYLNMAYQIDEIAPLTGDTAQARVTWNIQTKNRATQGLRNLTRTYQVWFVKESGQWRIQALEPAG